MEIENGRIMATLTVGEYREIVKDMLEEHVTPKEAPHTYVYGINGICKLFGVSRSTAQTYKDTFLQDAVQQYGRKIVVDVELAMALFRQKKYL